MDCTAGVAKVAGDTLSPSDCAFDSAGSTGNLNICTDYPDGGDQLLVYTGSRANPTFLCALDNTIGATGSSDCPSILGTGWHQTECVHNQQYFSALPPGLTAGVDAIAFDRRRNWAYSPGG